MRETVTPLGKLLSGKPVERFANAVEAVEDATLWLLDAKADAGRSADVLAAADAYLKLMGDVVGGWMLAKGALAAKAKLDAGDGDAEWLEGKIGCTRSMPPTCWAMRRAGLRPWGKAGRCWNG